MPRPRNQGCPKLQNDIRAWQRRTQYCGASTVFLRLRNDSSVRIIAKIQNCGNGVRLRTGEVFSSRVGAVSYKWHLKWTSWQVSKTTEREAYGFELLLIFPPLQKTDKLAAVI